MSEVFVGIGSNVEPERRIREALRLMRQRFGALRISPVYRNPAVGFQGDDFYNLVVGFQSNGQVAALNAALDEIEENAAGCAAGHASHRVPWILTCCCMATW